MEAPTYPPAAVYEQPVIQSYRFGTRTASIAELMADPRAWAITLKHVPFMKMATMSEDIQPALGNMAMEDLAVFVPMLSPALPALDEELATLPAVSAQGNA